MYKERTEWKEPLLRILEGHSDLLRETSRFPPLEGRLPTLGKLPELKDIRGMDPVGISAIVVIVVVVAVAARPQPALTDELLRAKLLDVYSPKEREALGDAVALVRENPELVEATIGINYEDLGKDFMGQLELVQSALGD